MPTQKNFDQLLIFVNLYHHAKKSVIPSVHSSGTVSFRVPSPDWAHPFLTMPTQKIFDQLLIYVNFYQNAKNQAVLLICSRDMTD